MEVGCLFFENRTKGIIGQLWRDFWWKPAGWSGYRSVLFNKLNLEPRSTPLQRCETESLQLLSDILPPYLSIDVATIWILSPLEHFLSNFLSINKTDSRCSLTAEMLLLLKKKKHKKFTRTCFVSLPYFSFPAADLSTKPDLSLSSWVIQHIFTQFCWRGTFSCHTLLFLAQHCTQRKRGTGRHTCASWVLGLRAGAWFKRQRKVTSPVKLKRLHFKGRVWHGCLIFW